MIKPDDYAEQENKDEFNWLGNLNSEDTNELRKKILEGFGIPKKLVELVKNLGED